MTNAKLDLFEMQRINAVCHARNIFCKPINRSLWNICRNTIWIDPNAKFQYVKNISLNLFIFQEIRMNFYIFFPPFQPYHIHTTDNTHTKFIWKFEFIDFCFSCPIQHSNWMYIFGILMSVGAKVNIIINLENGTISLCSILCFVLWHRFSDSDLTDKPYTEKSFGIPSS